MCEWDTILGHACKNEEDKSKWSKSKGTSASVLSRAGMQVGSFRSPFVLRGGGNLGGPGREHEDTSSDQCVGAGQEDLEFEAPVQNDRCTLHLCLDICLIYRLPQAAHCNLSVTSTLNYISMLACLFLLGVSIMTLESPKGSIVCVCACVCKIYMLRYVSIWMHSFIHVCVLCVCLRARARVVRVRVCL